MKWRVEINSWLRVPWKNRSGLPKILRRLSPAESHYITWALVKTVCKNIYFCPQKHQSTSQSWCNIIVCIIQNTLYSTQRRKDQGNYQKLWFPQQVVPLQLIPLSWEQRCGEAAKGSRQEHTTACHHKTAMGAAREQACETLCLWQNPFSRKDNQPKSNQTKKQTKQKQLKSWLSAPSQ